MKEIFEAFNSRIKSPVFGYFALAFIVINWKVIFFLFASASLVVDRFKYFDDNTNTMSLLIKPLFWGICGAIGYPWISLLFTWLIKRPVEYRQIMHVTTKNKILIKEQEFEEIRSKLLATKEKDLISRAKRDEQINSLTDENLRTELQKEIEDLRTQLGNTENKLDSSTKNSSSPDLIEIYMELAKLYEKTKEFNRAQEYMHKAAELRNSGY